MEVEREDFFGEKDDIEGMTYNISYEDDALSATNASGDLDKVSGLKYKDVFNEGSKTVNQIFFDDDNTRETSCGDFSCTVTCSCNEGNGWYDTASKANSSDPSKVIKLTSTREYALLSANPNTGKKQRTCYKKEEPEVFFDIKAISYLTIDKYSDRIETNGIYNIQVDSSQISADDVKLKVYVVDPDGDDSDDETQANDEKTAFGGGVSFGMEVYDKNTKQYTATLTVKKVEIYIKDALAHTTKESPFYTASFTPKEQTFTYNNQSYNIIPEKHEEVYDNDDGCDPGYFGTKPDSNFFKYETKNGCYKTTGCVENGLISATKDTSCSNSLMCKTPASVSYGDQTCYVNWPSYLYIDFGLNCGNNRFEGDTCSGSGDMICCFDSRKSGIYWARAGGNDLLYKLSVDDVNDYFYLDSINVGTTLNQSVSFLAYSSFGNAILSGSHPEIAYIENMKNMSSSNLNPMGYRCDDYNNVSDYFTYTCLGKKGFSENSLGEDKLYIEDNTGATGKKRYDSVSGHKMKLCYTISGAEHCDNIPLRTYFNAYPKDGQL